MFYKTELNLTKCVPKAFQNKIKILIKNEMHARYVSIHFKVLSDCFIVAFGLMGSFLKIIGRKNIY